MLRKLLLAVFLNISLFCIGQCPNVDILLSSQSEVNAFASNYPDCTTLNVNLQINGSDIMDLSGLSQIISLNGKLSILANPLLVTMSGLSDINFFGPNSELIISNNPLLTTISNFSGTINTSDFSSLSIQNNPNLESLNGLSGITFSSSLWVVRCNSLTSLSGVENMSISGSILGIEDNELLNNINALSGNLGEFKSIQITRNPLLTSLSGVEGVNFVQNSDFNLSIYENALINLDQLSSITRSPRFVYLRGSEKLSDITGLSNMVGDIGDLEISDNPQLVSLAGLQGITSVDNNLTINNNGLLQNLTGIENIRNIGGTPVLIARIQNNAILNDISALSSLEVDSIGFFFLSGNSSLSQCAIDVICGAIQLGRVNIENNNSDCNSTTDVEQGCLVLSSDEFYFKNNVTIGPNPVENVLKVYLENGVQLIKITIYSDLGNRIFTSNKLESNMSYMPIGIYFAKISTTHGVVVKKLIKK